MSIIGALRSYKLAPAMVRLLWFNCEIITTGIEPDGIHPGFMPVVLAITQLPINGSGSTGLHLESRSSEKGIPRIVTGKNQNLNRIAYEKI